MTTLIIFFSTILFISILIPVLISIYYLKLKPKKNKTNLKNFHISINQTYKLSVMPNYIVKVVSINNTDEKVSLVTTTETNKVNLSMSKTSFLKNYEPTDKNLYVA